MKLFILFFLVMDINGLEHMRDEPNDHINYGPQLKTNPHLSISYIISTIKYKLAIGY